MTGGGPRQRTPFVAWKRSLRDILKDQQNWNLHAREREIHQVSQRAILPKRIKRMALDIILGVPIGLLVVRRTGSDAANPRHHLVDGLLRCLLLRHLFQTPDGAPEHAEWPCVDLRKLFGSGRRPLDRGQALRRLRDEERLGSAILPKAAERPRVGRLALWRLMGSEPSPEDRLPVDPAHALGWELLRERVAEFPVYVACLNGTPSLAERDARADRCQQSLNVPSHRRSLGVQRRGYRLLWDHFEASLTSAGADPREVSAWLEVSGNNAEATAFLLRLIADRAAPDAEPSQPRIIAKGLSPEDCAAHLPALAAGIRDTHAFWQRRCLTITKPYWYLVSGLAHRLDAFSASELEGPFTARFWRMLMADIPQDPRVIRSMLDGSRQWPEPLVANPLSFVRRMLDWAPEHSEQSLRALLDFLLSPDSVAGGTPLPQHARPDGTMQPAHAFLREAMRNGESCDLDHIIPESALRECKARSVVQSPLNKWALPSGMNRSKNDRPLPDFARSSYLTMLERGRIDDCLSQWTNSHGFHWLPLEEGATTSQLQTLLADRSGFFWKRLERLQPSDASVSPGQVRGLLLEGLRERWGG